MLSFAAFLPHPPIIIPTIGRDEDLKKVKKTISAMNLIGQEFRSQNIETAFLVSPHGPLDPYRMIINVAPNLQGHFRIFGDSQTNLKFKNDLNLLKALATQLEKESFPFLLIDEAFLDHGALVPLYYLSENRSLQFRLIPLSYSLLDREKHFQFGEIIGRIINDSPKRIAFIASGDLSHRITPEAPAGFSPKGKIFDETIVSLLKNKKTKEILNLDEDFVEEAGQCGYRSLLILLGVLNHFDWQLEILSYEAPFGVGYLVAQFKISDLG